MYVAVFFFCFFFFLLLLVRYRLLSRGRSYVRSSKASAVHALSQLESNHLFAAAGIPRRVPSDGPAGSDPFEVRPYLGGCRTAEAQSFRRGFVFVLCWLLPSRACRSFIIALRFEMLSGEFDFAVGRRVKGLTNQKVPMWTSFQVALKDCQQLEAVLGFRKFPFAKPSASVT